MAQEELVIKTVHGEEILWLFTVVRKEGETDGLLGHERTQ